MKNLMFLLFALIVSAKAFAQDGVSKSLEAAIPASKRYFQIRLEPQWLALKELSLDFQFRLGDHFTLGPTVAIMSKGEGVFYSTYVSNRLLMDDRTERQTYGLRGSYYFNGVERKGTVISLFTKQSQNEVTSSGAVSFVSKTETGKFEETVTGISAGYRWVWGMVTMNISGGIANYNYPKSFEMSDSSGNKSKRTLDGLGSDSPTSYVFDAGIGLIF